MKLSDSEKSPAPGAFEISQHPVVFGRGGQVEEAPFAFPRRSDSPVVFAIARDPQSLFVYWNIDWTAVFGEETPRERKIYLRLLDENGAELQRATVEPLTSSCDISLPPDLISTRVEIGFFESDDQWHSVGASAQVRPPANAVGPLRPGDFALVPFDITFQRLTDLFRRSHGEQEPLIQSLADLQKRGADPTERKRFTADENLVFHAMQAASPAGARSPCPPATPIEETKRQHWIERVLGFGRSSFFGGSSRSA